MGGGASAAYQALAGAAGRAAYQVFLRGYACLGERSLGDMDSAAAHLGRFPDDSVFRHDLHGGDPEKTVDGQGAPGFSTGATTTVDGKM